MEDLKRSVLEDAEDEAIDFGDTVEEELNLYDDEDEEDDFTDEEEENEDNEGEESESNEAEGEFIKDERREDGMYNEDEEELEEETDNEIEDEVIDWDSSSDIIEDSSEELENSKDIEEVDEKGEASFLNEDGELVLMSPDNTDYFQLKKIDLRDIAVTKRIRSDRNVEDLVQSVKSTGLLQPICVAPLAVEGKYVLIHGYRRVLACAKAGIKEIPAVVNNGIRTTEIPMIEAVCNHGKDYSIMEIIEYIDYLEKELEILSPSMIEYLLQMNNGDYAKLKDLLNDDDPEIMEKLLDGQYTIAQAFKKLEQRRNKESKEEKEMQKVGKVYGNTEESGAEQLEGSGLTGDEGAALSEDELKELAILADDFEDSEASLEEMIEDSSKIDGFEPHVQKVGEREFIDPAMRKAVMDRDENTCRCCDEGGPEYVDVNDFHHVLPVFLGGPDTPENAICVCVKCHKLIHLHSRGQLHLLNIESMSEKEKEKFKKIIHYGNVIRKGMAMKGMKLEELKKLDGNDKIGRQMPGTKNTVS